MLLWRLCAHTSPYNLYYLPSSTQAYAAMRCHGKTRAGKTCSITSTSTLTDDRGKLVALPLQRGGDYCALHAKPFQTRPADVDASKAVILVFVDTETTGVDIARDRTAPITRGEFGRVGPARLWGGLHTKCEQDCRARRFLISGGQPPSRQQLLHSCARRSNNLARKGE